MTESVDTSVTTSANVGVFQGDVIVKTALEAGIQQLIANPSQLDYIWASLAQDPLTSGVPSYGIDQIRTAKEWFLQNPPLVFMADRVADDARKSRFITLRLGVSDEIASTLGEMYHTPNEDSAKRPFMTPRFSPVSFNWVSGAIEVPESLLAYSPLLVGAVVVFRDGSEYPITELLGRTVCAIANRGKQFDTMDMRIRYPDGGWAREIHGAVFQHTFTIGAHAYGEAVECLFLSAVVQWILTQGRMELLEARGFQLSRLKLGSFDEDPQFGEGNIGFSRSFQLTGQVYETWVQSETPKIMDAGVFLTEQNTRLRVIGGEHRPFQINLENLDDLDWWGELDMINPTPTNRVGQSVAARAVYWGASDTVAISSASQVLAFAKRTQPSRQGNFPVSVPTGQSAFFVMPVSMGVPGLVGFSKQPAGVSVAGVACQVWKSDATGLGDVVVTIS